MRDWVDKRHLLREFGMKSLGSRIQRGDQTEQSLS
jgi:hypothetical protein